MTENYFYPDTDERRCDSFITERFYLDEKSCDRLIKIMKKNRTCEEDSKHRQI